MPRGLRQRLNLQFDATLEFIENGLRVGENLTITTKFVKSKSQQISTLKSQQIKPFVKLSAHILKSWGINYLIFKLDKNIFGLTNIPPILENNTYVKNFQQKAKIFNDYFTEKCKIHDNDFISRTDISISYLDVNTDQIVNIIQKYSAKKANGCDEISVTMLQLCATEVALPLCLIFQKCLSTGTFPDLWKRANVQPILNKKKTENQIKLQAYFTFTYLRQNIRKNNF